MQFAAGWGDKLPSPLNDAGMVFLSETIKGAAVAMPSLFVAV
jgi:hypothetical protein